MNLQLSEIQFSGFTRQERRMIDRYIEKHGIREYTFSVVQEIADLIGRDIGTMIEPSGAIKLLVL